MILLLLIPIITILAFYNVYCEKKAYKKAYEEGYAAGRIDKGIEIQKQVKAYHEEGIDCPCLR